MGGFEVDFQTLELDHDASDAEVRQAYKDLVMVWHPDRFCHNPRLRQKAEEKLKLFNQAYEHLKARQPVSTTRRQTQRSQWSTTERASAERTRTQGARAGRSRAESRSPRGREYERRSPQSDVNFSDTKTSDVKPSPRKDLYISLDDAVLILQRFSFRLCQRSYSSYREYQGGPFVLMVCDAPPEVMISVPCDSLQLFDRILLSIPCKSMGHFIEQEAEQLLQLLKFQEFNA